MSSLFKYPDTIEKADTIMIAAPPYNRKYESNTAAILSSRSVHLFSEKYVANQTITNPKMRDKYAIIF